MIDSELFSILDVVDSSNNYAMEQLRNGKGKHGMAWLALNQTNGKGQRGKNWQSVPGKSLLMSICLIPQQQFKPKPFVFSAAVANFCRQFLEQQLQTTFFCKWPNDLYFNDKKTGGLLIENSFSGNDWNWAVVGIGINVGQTEFGETLPHAISLQQIKPIKKDTVSLAKALHAYILQGFETISTLRPQKIMEEFNNHLYKKGCLVKLKYGQIVSETRIMGVNDFGQLETVDVLPRLFNVGEVEWIK